MSEPVKLNYDVSDINKGLKGGLEYLELKDSYAKKEDVERTENEGKNLISLEKYFTNNNLDLYYYKELKLYFITGNLYRTSSNTEIPNNTWVTIAKIKDFTPARTVPLNAITVGSSKVKVRLNASEGKVGNIELYSYDSKITAETTLYITGLYR